VEAGGLLSSTYGYLSGGFSGSTSTATITGAGSKWTNSADLHVGRSRGGELRVEAGGQVSNTSGYMGNGPGTTGTATIIGAGSKWINDGYLFVGGYGRGVLTISAGGLVSVRDELTIDVIGGGDSFINMAAGGMLALWGDADDSLAQFLGLVAGTDAIRSWDAGLADWAPLTAATLGVDYTLQHQTAGDLLGYTLLTVGTLPPAGDFNLDGRVDGGDLLAWQRGASPLPNSPEDLATWRAEFDPTATTPAIEPPAELAPTAVPEPGTFALVGLALPSRLLRCRSTRGVFRSDGSAG
jgi:T5SS/PEP-CTERM-associated repeat protein